MSDVGNVDVVSVASYCVCVGRVSRGVSVAVLVSVVSEEKSWLGVDLVIVC